MFKVSPVILVKSEFGYFGYDKDFFEYLSKHFPDISISERGLVAFRKKGKLAAILSPFRLDKREIEDILTGG